MNAEIVKTLMAMASFMRGGERMSEDGAKIMLMDLSGYDVNHVLIALEDCRKELSFFPSVADIISRIKINDGRPGAEEAWSMLPKDDFKSIVWTEEMREAYGIAHYLIIEDDRIAARMAFKEKYESLVSQARKKNIPAKWTPSFGVDKSGREVAIKEAVEKNRLTSSIAQSYLPEAKIKPDIIQLEDQSEYSEQREEIVKIIKGIFK